MKIRRNPPLRILPLIRKKYYYLLKFFLNNGGWWQWLRVMFDWKHQGEWSKVRWITCAILIIYAFYDLKYHSLSSAMIEQNTLSFFYTPLWIKLVLPVDHCHFCFKNTCFIGSSGSGVGSGSDFKGLIIISTIETNENICTFTQSYFWSLKPLYSLLIHNFWKKLGI